MRKLRRKTAAPRQSLLPGYSRSVWVAIWIFLILDLIVNLIWMYTIPMAKAPDEEFRIILSDSIVANGALPNAWDEAVRIHGWGFSYALRPMLVNMIGALNLWIVSLFTQDLWAQVLAVRLVSVLSAGAMVYFCFRIAEWLEWKPCWAFMLGCICAFTPQITFLAGYHNNDMFCLACVTATLYCWIRGMRERWTWPDCFRLAISLGLLILSYYNAYSYVLFSIPLFFMTIFRRHMSREQRMEAFQKTGVIILVTFLIAGWWFIRNIILYDGDMLGSQTRLVMGEKYAIPSLKPSAVFKPIREGISYFELWSYAHGDPFNWAKKTFMSTIALLGQMDFLFPAQVYDWAAWILRAGSGLFVIQYLVWLVSQIKNRFKNSQVNQQMLFYLFAFLSAVIVIALALYYSWTDDFQPQGRYIMPAFTTFALIMTAGFRSIFVLLSRLIKNTTVNSVLGWLFCLPVCLSMLSLQGYAYWRIYPSYMSYPRTGRTYQEHRETYGPPSTRSDSDARIDQERAEKAKAREASLHAASQASSSSGQ